MDNLTLTIFHAHYNTVDRKRLEEWTQVLGYSKSLKEVIVSLMIEGYIMTIVGLFGIFGNLLSAWILSRPRMRDLPINALFLGLAFADTLLIFIFGFGVGVPSICSYHGVNFSKMRAIIALLPSFYAMVFTAHTSSVYFILTITIERYFGVCHPFRESVLLRSWRIASYASIVVLLLSIVINLPRWWEFTYTSRYLNSTESTPDLIYLPITADLRKNLSYEQFIFACYALVNFALPILVIAFLNFRIFKELRLANRRKIYVTTIHPAPPLSCVDNSLSIILLIIVLIFLICNSPFLINIIASFITGSSSVFVIDQLRNFLWTFNSSVNFLIYYAYSEKFRFTLTSYWRWRHLHISTPFKMFRKTKKQFVTQTQL